MLNSFLHTLREIVDHLDGFEMAFLSFQKEKITVTAPTISFDI